MRKGMQGESTLLTELDKARFASSVANERAKAFQEKLQRCKLVVVASYAAEDRVQPQNLASRPT